MKKQILALAIVSAFAATPAALAASDPTSAARADIEQLRSDAKTQHDIVIGDAQKLRGAGRTGFQDALQTLRDHRAAAVSLLQGDRDKVKADLDALRASKVKPADLKTVLQQAEDALKQQRSEVQAAIGSAKEAEHQAMEADKAQRQDAAKAEQAKREAAAKAEQAKRQAAQDAARAEQAKREAAAKAAQDAAKAAEAQRQAAAKAAQDAAKAAEAQRQAAAKAAQDAAKAAEAQRQSAAKAAQDAARTSTVSVPNPFVK